MSKSLPIILSFVYCSFLYSQDEIYLEERGSTIEVSEITQNEISTIKSENGDPETFGTKHKSQTSASLTSNSSLYLQHSNEENKKNTDGEGVLRIARNEFKNLTKCRLADSKDDADFTVEIQVIKRTLGNRRAKFTIKHLLTGKTVYESEWVKGSPSEFNGFSGTRRAIGKIIKKGLIKTYPEISKG